MMGCRDVTRASDARAGRRPAPNGTGFAGPAISAARHSIEIRLIRGRAGKPTSSHRSPSISGAGPGASNTVSIYAGKAAW
jgi:hypothetical protein